MEVELSKPNYGIQVIYLFHIYFISWTGEI